MSSQTGFQIKINLPISVVCFRNLQVNELQIARITIIISVVDAVKIHTNIFFFFVTNSYICFLLLFMRGILRMTIPW